MTDEEIKALPAEVLREALYTKTVHDIGDHLLDIEFCIGKVWNFDLDSRLREVQKLIEDAKALDPHPDLPYDNLWFARNVVGQLMGNPTVRDNPDLTRWGLLAAANCCGVPPMFVNKLFRRWGRSLKRRGLNNSCFYTINRKEHPMRHIKYIDIDLTTKDGLLLSHIHTEMDRDLKIGIPEGEEANETIMRVLVGHALENENGRFGYWREDGPHDISVSDARAISWSLLCKGKTTGFVPYKFGFALDIEGNDYAASFSVDFNDDPTDFE